MKKASGTLGHGRARLLVQPSPTGGSFLKDRYFGDPYRLFTPRTAPGEPLSVVVGTLSGGLTGGDRLELEAKVESGAAAQIVGQAAEKIYRSAGPDTHLGFDLSLEAGSWLELVPQETILFDGSRLDRRFTIKAEPGAEALIGDMVVFGRLAMGEVFEAGLFRDTWRLELDGELKWFDRFGFAENDAQALRENAFGLGSALAMATVLYVGSDTARVVELLRDEEREWDAKVRNGVTDLSTHALIRLHSQDPQALRKQLGGIWRLLRSELKGYRPELPALWSI